MLLGYELMLVTRWFGFTHCSLSAVTHAPFHASMLRPASQAGPIHKAAGVGKLVNAALLSLINEEMVWVWVGSRYELVGAWLGIWYEFALVQVGMGMSWPATVLRYWSWSWELWSYLWFHNSRMVVSASVNDWQERLVSEMTYTMSMGTLNPTQLFVQFCALYNKVQFYVVGTICHWTGSWMQWPM